MLETGNTLHVAMHVKVTCIGEVIGTLMVETGEGGVGTKPTENFLLTTQSRLFKNVGNTF